MKKSYIFTVHHKKDDAIDVYLKYFHPMQVGAAIAKTNLFIDRDDIGENISKKNKNYCELTAHYNVWRRDLEVDYIGLMHYRRVFSNKFPLMEKILDIFKLITNRIFYIYPGFACLNTSRVNKIKDLEDVCKEFYAFLNKECFDIILPVKKKYQFYSLEHEYCINHCRSHFDLFNKLVIESFPEMKSSVDKVCQEKEAYSYNMFVMKKEIFDDYSSKLFSVLKKIEDVVDISYLNDYQKRIFGFLSERFLNYYIDYINNNKKLKIKELYVAFVDIK